LWDVVTGKEQRKIVVDKGNGLDFRAGIYSIAFTPDGKTLAGGLARWVYELEVQRSGEIKLWDVANGMERSTLQGHKWHVNSVAFSPDGTRLASGSTDNTAKV